MHHRLSCLWRLRGAERPARRLRPAAFAVGSAIAFLAPAAAGAATSSSPTVAVTGSSVIVTGQPEGPTTVTASRRDPSTGKPVIIGRYSGVAGPYLPFTVNTTAPTATAPDGDCWQQGALPSALTPDLRPGDTVTVSGTPGPLGGGGPSTSVTVAADARPSEGPIPACASVAPFAQNMITDAPGHVSAEPITISGRAQPLATDVSITASDGTRISPAASATPAGDGTWSATIPADQVAALADGPLTLSPVVAAPDVGTGAQAHVAGAPLTVQKVASGGGPPIPSAAGAGAGTATLNSPGRPGSTAPASGRSTVARRVSGLRMPGRLSLGAARGQGISASFIAPAGASIVQLQLLRGGRVVDTTIASVARPGTRQTVRLSRPAVRRLLRPGRYTLRVRAGASLHQLGSPLLRSLIVG
jgi:hypothetical protein